MKRLLADSTRFFTAGLFAWLVFLLPPFASSAEANELHAAITPTEIPHQFFDPERVTELQFFATIINDTDFAAQNCRITLGDELPFVLHFWATDSTTNQIVGVRDAPVDIAARDSQAFLFTLDQQSNEHVPEQRVRFVFDCETHQTAAQVQGVNDLLLSAGTPSVLLAIATPDESNRVVLDTQLQGDPCSVTRRGDAEPAPCAFGLMALAIVNVESAPLNLVVAIDGQIGIDSLLCRTSPAGDCLEIAQAVRGVELELQPDEIATFSAFLLSFHDGYFDFSSGLGPASIGFNVSTFNPIVPHRLRRVAGATTELVTNAFEWSAIRTAGQLTVRGSVSIGSSCSDAMLEVKPDAQPNPGELILEVGEGDPELITDIGQIDPSQLVVCLAAIARDRVAWTSEGPIEDIERVIVTRPGFGSAEPETLTLVVQNPNPAGDSD